MSDELLLGGYVRVSGSPKGELSWSVVVSPGAPTLEAVEAARVVVEAIAGRMARDLGSSGKQSVRKADGPKEEVA